MASIGHAALSSTRPTLAGHAIRAPLRPIDRARPDSGWRTQGAALALFVLASVGIGFGFGVTMRAPAEDLLGTLMASGAAIIGAAALGALAGRLALGMLSAGRHHR